jgi:hypothetical protein
MKNGFQILLAVLRLVPPKSLTIWQPNLVENPEPGNSTTS